MGPDKGPEKNSVQGGFESTTFGFDHCCSTDLATRPKSGQLRPFVGPFTSLGLTLRWDNLGFSQRYKLPRSVDVFFSWTRNFAPRCLSPPKVSKWGPKNVLPGGNPAMD